MKKFFVLEITEREISSLTPCSSIDEGIKIANDMLKSLIGDIYELDLCTLQEDGGEDNDYGFANRSSLCAWCNLRHTNWDAHICELPED